MLKYKLSKSEKILDISDNLDDSSNQFLHSTKLESENMQVSSKSDIFEVNQNIQIIIEENEALRKGMHEIMDSIRNQDGEWFSLTLMVLWYCTHFHFYDTLDFLLYFFFSAFCLIYKILH